MQGAISLFRLVFILAAGLAFVYLLTIVLKMRRGIAWFGRAFGFALLWYFAATMILGLYAYWFAQAMKPQVTNLAGLASVIAFTYKWSRRRSRHIPLSVKRMVIERDLKGQPFDPKEHHIDHIWAHSRWGSNTFDNLRVRR